MIPERYKNVKYEDVPKDIREKFEKIHETRKGMYIHGCVGSGKTHMAYSLKKYWDSKASKGAMFWNTAELMREIKMDFDRSAMEKTRAEEKILRFTGLLFIDDIGSEKMTEFVAETFYMIINHRYEKRLPIIFTSNLPIGDLSERVGDRTTSRIVEMCDVVELSGSDRRMEKASKIKVWWN